MKTTQSISGLLALLGESFPSPIHVPEDQFQLTLSHSSARLLHSDLSDLIERSNRLEFQCKLLRGLIREIDPQVADNLSRLGLDDYIALKI